MSSLEHALKQTWTCVVIVTFSKDTGAYYNPFHPPTVFSAPQHAVDLLSGNMAVMKHAAPATMLAVAKGRRRPMRSMVKRMRNAAGNSTRPEMRKSM